MNKKPGVKSLVTFRRNSNSRIGSHCGLFRPSLMGSLHTKSLFIFSGIIHILFYRTFLFSASVYYAKTYRFNHRSHSNDVRHLQTFRKRGKMWWNHVQSQHEENISLNMTKKFCIFSYMTKLYLSYDFSPDYFQISL